MGKQQQRAMAVMLHLMETEQTWIVRINHAQLELVIVPSPTQLELASRLEIVGPPVQQQQQSLITNLVEEMALSENVQHQAYAHWQLMMNPPKLLLGIALRKESAFQKTTIMIAKSLWMLDSLISPLKYLMQT